MKQGKKISFRLVAYTDAAGKYFPDAFRSGNEDNFFVDDDLTDTTTNSVAQDEIIQLGELGMLMVVADGMGGMNAGEVASQIAVDTVKSAFKTDLLKASVTATVQTRQKYLEQVIRKADREIKSEARKDKAKEGMGSTIIIAWLFDNELTISWCGDSRAYIFNEKSGIRLISEDHSYVQELVNKGLLTYAQTFDHPQNNIITRSLGDPTKEAKPDSKTLNVGKGDIILLCSDGLSGVLRDRKTYDDKGQLYPEENLEDIIRCHVGSMKECRESLWEAAERGCWYDNVTAILCQITDGPESRWEIVPDKETMSSNGRYKKIIFLYSAIGVLVAGAIVGAFFLGKGAGKSEDKDEVMVDSLSVSVNESNDEPAVKEKVGVNKIIDSPISSEAKEAKKNTIPDSKPTVAEQIQKQVEENGDSVLTIIPKDKNTEEVNVVSSVKNKLKGKTENPSDPNTIYKEERKDTSKNN